MAFFEDIVIRMALSRQSGWFIAENGIRERISRISPNPFQASLVASKMAENADFAAEIAL